MKEERDPLRYFQAQLSINKEDLDEELSNFPSMFFTVSDYYLDAHKHRRRLEARLDRKYNTITTALRRAAHDAGEKVTEAQIKQEALIHPSYTKSQAKLADAVYIQDRWQALKDAFIQKSFSLKGLVALSSDERFQHDTARKRG